MMIFKKGSNEKISTQIINEIKDGISSGKYKRGDKLPSEREISANLGVSRASVREAIRSIELLGLIHCVQGEGNFVAESMENSLFEPLSLMFMMNGGNCMHIHELRRALEFEAVSQAVLKVTTQELEKLDAICRQLEDEDNVERRIKLDRQFHYTLAKITKNDLIIMILNATSQLLDNYVEKILRTIYQEKNGYEQVNSHHRAIYHALCHRNLEDAMHAMTNHMDFAGHYTKFC